MTIRFIVIFQAGDVGVIDDSARLDFEAALITELSRSTGLEQRQLHIEEVRIN
jgi:hypothetical protein